MKLIAYKTFEYNCQKLVPAARTREWMDKTPGSFAYHCLPLVMANSLGWFIPSTATASPRRGHLPQANCCQHLLS